MKAVFISYNQTLTERVQKILDHHSVRGFTRWDLTHGRGTHTGEPHYGNHAWPAMNTSVLAIMEESKVKPLLDSLRALDEEVPQNGLRVFTWNIEEQV